MALVRRGEVDVILLASPRLASVRFLSQPMNHVISVAIVGGGPCGLLCALLLARQGVPCAVFEKNPGISTHPKAMALSRRTVEIFRQLGLQPAFEAISLPLEGRSLAVWSMTLSGEELGRTPLRAYRTPFSAVTPLHCPQTETERILLDALRLEPLAEIYFGAEVTSVRLGQSGGELRLANGQTCVFSWLIAADGAGSRLRKQFGVSSTGPGDMGHFLNIMFEAPYGEFLKDRPALLYNCFWEGGFETFVSINGHDKWLMHHFLEPGQEPEDFPLETLPDLVRAASGLHQIPVKILAVTPWVMSPKLSTAFRSGPVFFVGDAAARLSPAGGLGLNNGLQGVHNLAWKLAAVVRGLADTRLLDTYHAERHSHSARLLNATNSNAAEMFAIAAEAAEGDWEAVRQHIGCSRRNGAGLGIDLGVSYKEGAFVPDGCQPYKPADSLNDYFPSAVPGSRAPHAPVNAPSGQASLHDFFGNTFTLLIGKDAPPGWPAEDRLLRKFKNGRDFEAPEFETLYGITNSGAVLVRPDGIVAARWYAAPENPSEMVLGALDQILR